MNQKTTIIAAIVLLVVIAGAVVMMKGSNSQSAANNQAAVTQATPAATDATATTSAMDHMAMASDSASPSAQVKEFTVTGSNYSFAPSAITVKKGDTVKITFKNSEGFHNFIVDQFNAKTKTIPAGKEDSVEFVADKTGAFQYYCGVGNHRQMGMVGTLTVQ